MQNDKSKFKEEFNKRLIGLSISILKYCRDNKGDYTYQIIYKQLIRSITSIGANVIEAKAASSRRDYIKYFEIALKSANESMYWLILLEEYSGKNDKLFGFRKELKEVTSIIASSILTLKGKR